MFDYPVPRLPLGLYEQLGLSPEATAEEINEARLEVSTRLQNEKKAVDRRLDVVFTKVPELRGVYEKIEQLQSAGAGADPNEYRTVQHQAATLIERAIREEPDFLRLRQESADLERQVHTTNLIALSNPAERLGYDRKNPPLELLKLADCGVIAFEDNKVALALVRHELASFFEESGEDVFHPSDLTRDDFTHDFTEDRNLDRKQ